MRMTALETGEEIAGYRVIEFVGSGGMGDVYRALHPVLQRVVALKVMRPEIAAEAAFRERFRREARLIASIDHPTIVPVYDAGEVDGMLFVAMRWVAGRDLRRLLAAEGPLEPARAVRVLGQLAAGVDAAHKVGLVHRDIKPANVLLEGDRVFLSDFGVARSLAGTDTTTASGGFRGTVDYAAPELFDGRVTPSADVYSLGCVLYEMLTGSVPYPVEGLLGKIHAHAHAERPRPSASRPELPSGLDGVVQRSLAVDPAARFPTAGELSAAAERSLRTPSARQVASARGRRRRRLLLLAGGLLLVGAVAALVALMLRPSSGARLPYDAGGRGLPAAASLKACRRGGPRVCLVPGRREVAELGDQGRIVRMSTMDLDVTGVALASALPVRSTGGELTAPPGTRFIVIDLTVTNLTRAPHRFEPGEALNGRLTQLLLFAGGTSLSYHGPRYADYSAQYSTALGAVPHALDQTVLPPGRPIRGQLVFYYPDAEIRKAKYGILSVAELGETFGADGPGSSAAFIRVSL